MVDDSELKKYLGTGNMTVVEAMQKIDRNAKGIIYIVDQNGKLLGSLTDGDLRRWIIRTGNLSGRASQMMRENVKFLTDRGTGDNIRRGTILMQEMKVTSVPVVSADKIVKEVIFLKDKGIYRAGKQYRPLLGTPVIVMAGGRGTRLYPFTKILPKPLIPIGDIPILERILGDFHAYGADEFYLTVNYKKEMIRSYFQELNPDYKIYYVEEDKPLGTAGSIRLIRQKFDVPVIITNCDILIEADYGQILEFHEKSRNALTIISSLKNTVIPYGVLHAQENGIVTEMEEKPHYSYLANTGMYVVQPEYLKKIPENTFYHMTHFANSLMKDGCQVGMYPVSEQSFLDMGEFEEMKKMEERISSGVIQ